ncbi:MAG: ribulose-phosphate 3-epimerase [Tissierellia bacterium]|nr:ribulose-phosphate 3-epimerase [Tissierellia bacterium]
MLELSPSLLSANFANLEADIKKLEEGGINYLHLDVMDGNYVPNISFGPVVIKSIRPMTDMIFDIHLMIEKPERYIEEFVNAGADILTFHYEASTHVHRTLQNIKSYGIKAGVSLNPATPLDTLEYIINDLDLVLIMSVNPGFGGQSYIEAMSRKIKSLKEMRQKHNADFIISVDGGIKTGNVRNVINMGAELIISGSDVFGADDIMSRLREYKEIFDEYR